jgi:hypothetical protein
MKKEKAVNENPQNTIALQYIPLSSEYGGYISLN